MPDTHLSADCARCTALCCAAFHFDRSDLFAFEKPAGKPCPNLDEIGLCRIYDRRLDEGFRGCVEYDCLGAGQRVTKAVSAERGWLGAPALQGSLIETFLATERAHRLILLLSEARKLDLSTEDRGRLDRLEAAVDQAALQPVGVARLEREIRRYLETLRLYVPPRPEPPPR